MATYNANNWQSDPAHLASSLCDNGNGADVTATFSLATTAFSTDHALTSGDIIRLCPVPKGALITDWYLYMPDCDSASSLVLDLGLATQDDNCFLDNSTIGQAGGVASGTNAPNGLVANALPLAVTADDYFALTAGGSSAGAGAGGTIKGWVRYSMRGNQF